MNEIFKKMTAKYFFTTYVNIPSWQKKLSGKNSNGNPVDFTDAEKEKIKKAWSKYLKELNKVF